MEALRVENIQEFADIILWQKFPSLDWGTRVPRISSLGAHKYFTWKEMLLRMLS